MLEQEWLNEVTAALVGQSGRSIGRRCHGSIRSALADVHHRLTGPKSRSHSNRLLRQIR